MKESTLCHRSSYYQNYVQLTRSFTLCLDARILLHTILVVLHNAFYNVQRPAISIVNHPQLIVAFLLKMILQVFLRKILWRNIYFNVCSISNNCI